MIIDKIKNSKSKNESRIIFNYFRIYEDLLDTHVKFSFKMHNYLFNLNHNCLFKINLKYIYFIILLYFKNKYYFAFIILNIE